MNTSGRPGVGSLDMGNDCREVSLRCPRYIRKRPLPRYDEAEVRKNNKKDEFLHAFVAGMYTTYLTCTQYITQQPGFPRHPRRIHFDNNVTCSGRS